MIPPAILRPLVIGAGGLALILFAGATTIAAATAHYKARSEREREVWAQGYAAGAGETALAHRVEIDRLRTEADAREASAMAARDAAQDEMRKVSDDASKEIASALARARAAERDDKCLSRLVPDGLRLRAASDT